MAVGRVLAPAENQGCGRQLAVPAANQILEAEASRLKEAVTKLHARLSAIMRNPAPTTEQEPVNKYPPAACDLAMFIESISRQLAEASTELEFVIDHLEV